MAKILIAGQDLGAVGGLNAYTDGYADHLPDYMPAGVTTYTGLHWNLNGLADQINNKLFYGVEFLDFLLPIYFSYICIIKLRRCTSYTNSDISVYH